MTIMNRARKIILPTFQLTTVTESTHLNATLVVVPSRNEASEESYYIQPKYKATDNNNCDGLPHFKQTVYRCFPVVLDSMHVPWAEANVYILSRLIDALDSSMSTYISIAEDLAAYRAFLDETGLDWMNFPSQKLMRPTYRFRGHIKYLCGTGEIAVSTARRRMGSVIRFYRWLIRENIFIPEYSPWKESDCFIEIKNTHGFASRLKVQTTDISIVLPKQCDPYDGSIEDGAKLRPLSHEEQEWVLDALISSGNTEMLLIHLFGFLSGARIQTILTFRVKDVSKEIDVEQKEVRIPVGFGTGIDTKRGKRMVLHLPAWFYDALQRYANSNRAKMRRMKAIGGDVQEQYLFLSVRGAPLYQSKEDMNTSGINNVVRHVKSGQGVRQFIKEKIIPFIQEKYKATSFHFQFHDTRATAGMNWTDHQLGLVEQGIITLHQAREYVKVRMGHASSETTDKYLRYRHNLKQVRWALEGYENHLKELAAISMGKINE